MNLATRTTLAQSATATDRAVRIAGWITAAFLIATLWPMWRWSTSHANRTPPLLHLVALLVALGTLAAGPRAPQVVRDWMPLAIGPFLYVELRWLIEGLGRAHRDPVVLAWEHALFAGNPSSTWATRVPSAALSELLHFCYASYYLLVLGPPTLLYLMRRRQDFARTLLALTMVYAVCFTVYLLFPVDGPRYLVGPAHAPDGPVRSFVLHLLAAGSSRGTAFPSSHVAASVVASLSALQSSRRIGVPVSIITIGLMAATVYGGFHYAVDAVAGLVTGIIVWAVAAIIWRSLSDAGEQSASAA